MSQTLHELNMWHLRSRMLYKGSLALLSGGERQRCGAGPPRAHQDTNSALHWWRDPRRVRLRLHVHVRRVSIAMELVTNPQLLLLDEPTSGLDSFNALQVLHTLQAVAAGGRIVVTSLHQPSPVIFNMLSKVSASCLNVWRCHLLSSPGGAAALLCVGAEQGRRQQQAGQGHGVCVSALCSPACARGVQVLLITQGRLAFVGAPGDAPEAFAALGLPCSNQAFIAEHMLEVRPCVNALVHTSSSHAGTAGRPTVEVAAISLRAASKLQAPFSHLTVM